MFDFDLKIMLEDLIWQSDWNGDEVGFDDVEVVGLYSNQRSDGKEYYYYIDMEKMIILDFWVAED